jgi:hypothetical protein
MIVNSFLGLTRRVLRHDTQPGMRHYDAFRADNRFYLRQVKQHVLDDLGGFPLAACRRLLGSTPIEDPVIRVEREDALTVASGTVSPPGEGC